MMTSLSLFSGCLGLDLGLEQAGITTFAYVESDPVTQITIALNRPGVPILPDVRSLSGHELLDAAGLSSVDLVVGGPPCQSFSTMGRRGTLDDSRGQLILEFVRLVKEVKPAYFVLENVLGLTLPLKGAAPTWQEIQRQFRELGYDLAEWRLCALDYGSPQNRVRFVSVGARPGAELPDQPEITRGAQTLGEAIRGLEVSPGECGKFSPRVTRVLDLVPAGGNWRALPPAVRAEAMGNANTKAGGFTGTYRRLSYDKPSPTLLTSPTQRATTLCHPVATRPLSIAEYKRIQRFPDSWKLSGTTTQKYRQLGNAVPPPVGRAIGERLVACH